MNNKKKILIYTLSPLLDQVAIRKLALRKSDTEILLAKFKNTPLSGDFCEDKLVQGLRLFRTNLLKLVDENSELLEDPSAEELNTIEQFLNKMLNLEEPTLDKLGEIENDQEISNIEDLQWFFKKC